MGTFRETLVEGNEGPLHLGPERARVYSDLSPEDKERYNADIRATNILLQGLPKDIYTLINHYTEAKDIWDNVKMLLEGETIHNYYVRFSKLINDMRNIKMTMSRMQLNSKFVNNMLPEWGRFVTAVKLNRGLRDTNYDQLYAYLKQHENRGQGTNARSAGSAGYGELRTELGMQIQENGVALDDEQLLFITGGQDNVVDEGVDDQPVQDLALNVDNVFQVDDCDAFDSDVDEAPTAQIMFMTNLSSTYPIYDEASPSYDSDILSEVPDHDNYQDAVCEHHEVHEIHEDVQPNYVVDSHADDTSDSNMILYDQYVKDNTVPVVQIDNSLTAKLETYKEQVELYERRAKFELIKREQKINEQLRIVIADRNLKEENLKMELHSVKLQLTSTINHNKSMVEEVEDKLYKQYQSLQTVHMLCKPKPYYDAHNKVAISYKNPLCLTRAQQVQPALYNGHEFIKTTHVPSIVYNSEDTLEIAEITRKKINDKMKDPECVKKKVKIAPHDYSKQNYLATFTPQKQLTPE
ncbi:hypothetical protein Tco_0955868 [Tanacetum coccineum]|uniref:Integrase, catalytic region, zinc finger, CCHC-type, peptidase aspartic, catalytic n=1 Tax=Tanacetum coccineum TaxID=301880 RepID=A0ABQ5E8J3_9ASTR